MASKGHPPSMHLLLFVLLGYLRLLSVSAQPFPVQFTSCLSSSTAVPSPYLLNISQAWAQIVPGDRAKELGLPGDGRRVLRIDLVGETGEEFVGFNNETGKLATMFSTTSDMTYELWSTTTFACNSLFPPSPLPYPYIPNNTTYCPLDAGPFAINLSVPLKHGYPLSTLSTNVRIVDTAVPANELLCVELDMTTYYPQGWYYNLFFWLPIGLAIGYWVSSWAGRFAAGWVVGRMADNVGSGDVQGWGRQGGKSRKWGTMVVSGLSGERLGFSGGLLRFVTPSVRDVFFHLQFCAVLAMVAVQWPGFAYPIFATVSWASLAWNVTLVQGDRGSTKQFDPSQLPPNATYNASFIDQINSTSSPLYLDQAIPNAFFALPPGAKNGMESFAAAVGLRPQDLFGTCIVLFLCLAAGIIAVSLLIWTTHGMLTYVLSPSALGIDPNANTSANRSKRSSWGKSRSPNTTAIGEEADEAKKGTYGDPNVSGPNTPGQEVPMLAPNRPAGGPIATPVAVTAPSSRKSAWKRLWWRFKIKGPIGAYHYSALCGNLVRLIIMFHLPITTFSVYQWTIRGRSNLAVVVLAALSFAFFSVLLPAILLLRVATTPTAKLYDATRTLLSLGPLYNIYKPGSQLYRGLTFLASLATGIVVGAGQKSGTAQAIVILVIEIGMGLATTIWQPWGGGSGMGIPGFLLNVLRTISAVLLLILSPAIAIGKAAAGWVAYVILLLQAVTIVFFLVMLFCKILEGLIRLFGNVGFDESKHPLDGGLFAAFGGLRKKRREEKPSYQRRRSTQGSLNTQMMLDRYSDPRSSSIYEGTTPYMPVSYGAEYFPSQRRTSNGMGFTGRAGMPNMPTFEERLAAARPQRGFAVVRGGKANFEDPYMATGVHDHQMAVRDQIPTIRTSYHDETGAVPFPISGVAGPSNPAGPSKPVPPRHVRTRSQTAIVETFPGSQTPSPISGTPPYGVSTISPAMNHPSRVPSSGIHSLHAPAVDVARSVSPASTYSSDVRPTRTPKRASKPSTWFGRSNKANDYDDSDSESGPEQSDVVTKGKGRAGMEAVAAGGSGGSWLSKLGISKTPALPDERQSDENALRAAQISEYEASEQAAGRQPSSDGHRSFKVMRTPKSDKFPALPSAGPSPQPSRASTPGEAGLSAGASRQSSQNSRSVAVKAPNQASTDPESVAHEGATPGRSFIVNRPNRQA